MVISNLIVPEASDAILEAFPTTQPQETIDQITPTQPPTTNIPASEQLNLENSSPIQNKWQKLLILLSLFVRSPLHHHSTLLPRLQDYHLALPLPSRPRLHNRHNRSTYRNLSIPFFNRLHLDRLILSPRQRSLNSHLGKTLRYLRS